MDVVLWVLWALWSVVTWVWWQSPVLISLVLLGWLCGMVAVFLVPRETHWFPVVKYVRAPAPWAKGHDPLAEVPVVELSAEVPLSQGAYGQADNVVPLFGRKAA